MPGDRAQALRLFERAYEYQRIGDMEGAIRLYEASIAEFPTAEAHTFLGWVYSFAGRFDEAIAECKRAVAVDPTFGNPYNDIGVYLMEQGREDEAVPWFRRAMEAPRYEVPHYPHINLARIYEARGRTVDALAELTKADQKMPGLETLATAIRKLQQLVN